MIENMAKNIGRSYINLAALTKQAELKQANFAPKFTLSEKALYEKL